MNSISSLPMSTNNESYYYEQIISSQSINENNPIDSRQVNVNESWSANDSNTCSIEPINIDKPKSKSLSQSNLQQNTSSSITTAAAITNIDLIQFKSSWERIITTNNQDDNDSISLNIIQVIFTIPYIISNESIYNKTVFIIDAKHNELLVSLTDLCINESSFIINYSTIKSLPHNICLYLLLNISLSTTLREIVFCRTIDDSHTNISSSDDQQNGHSVGPSQFFILSQCIIIFIMMFFIYAVQTARQKGLFNRVSQRVVRSRPYLIIFGNRRNVSTHNNRGNTSVNPATTLESGLNQLIFHRQLTSLTNHQMPAPIEEQVLAATDLTSTSYDRRMTRTVVNRDLIDVKEFTKKISGPNESSTDAELYVL